MNCSEFQEEAVLHIDRGDFPEELTAHLASCDDCRQWFSWHEQMCEGFGSDGDFEPNEALFAELARGVEGRIAETSITNISTSWRRRFVGVAAAAVLVAGVGYLSLRNGSELVGDIDSLTPFDMILLDDDLSSNISEDEWQELAWETSSARSYETSELIVDDISDEELDFLEKNLSAGDLL